MKKKKAITEGDARVLRDCVAKLIRGDRAKFVLIVDPGLPPDEEGGREHFAVNNFDDPLQWKTVVLQMAVGIAKDELGRQMEDNVALCVSQMATRAKAPGAAKMKGAKK